MLYKTISIFFVAACILMGGLWANYVVDLKYEKSVTTYQKSSSGSSSSMQQPPPQPFDARPWMILGGIAGAILSIGILLLLNTVTQEMFERLSPALIFIALAMVVGYLLSRYITVFWQSADVTAQVFLTTTLVLVFGFMGISLGLTRATSWESLMKAVQRREVVVANSKIIDTSVIIDGRLVEICHTGFIEGTLIIPRFVLQELQRIADSPDELRRARGRRGLDILKQLQDPSSNVTVRVVEDDPVDIREVDSKLVRLARDFNAKILTNDLNLNKAAQIEGVKVLNINDLANALKPAVLPDERMQVRVVKEGKEAFQGVGYLDDGTMVVVDGGRDYVGRDVSVLVTSVLQTTAGRMIFTRLQNVLS